MKLNGKKLSETNKETVVLPRPSGDLVFVAAAVLDTDEFEKLVPEPKPPYIRKPGETEGSPDFTDKNYREQLVKRMRLQTLWLIIKSLAATPNLEWETVDPLKPETWEKLDSEFQTAGIINTERARIFSAVMRANSLDEAYLTKARDRFFASQQETAKPQ